MQVINIVNSTHITLKSTDKKGIYYENSFFKGEEGGCDIRHEELKSE